MLTKQDDTIRLLLPLSADCRLPVMRYTIDQLTPSSGGEIELLPASRTVAVRGSRATVYEARRKLAGARRSQRLTVKYRERLDSQVAVSVARVGTGENELKVAGSPDEEEIDGDATSIEYARLGKALMAEDAVTAEILVPLHAAGKIVSCSGRNRFSALMKNGVLMEAAGRICEDEKDTCKVFLSAATSEQIKVVEDSIQKIISSLPDPVQFKLNVDERLADWLLSNRRSELQRIIYKNGTSLSIHNESIVVHGDRSEPVRATAEEITRVSYDYHSCTLWLAENYETLPTLLEGAAKQSRVEIQQAPRTVDLFGTQDRLRTAIAYLQSAGVECLQIKYRLGQCEEIRDFISGKKDGKLIKIMKETGASISLGASTRLGIDSQIDIEIVAQEPDSLAAALDLLLGEFPAEKSFYLADSHHKRLIGHGGKTIQRVMKKYAVYIKFLNPEEAAVRSPVDAMSLPKVLACRLPNVLIRTPAKNEDALLAAQDEIHDMAEELEHQTPKKTIKFDRRALLGLPKDDLTKLAEFMQQFGETLDFTVSSTFSQQSDEDGSFAIRVRGYHSPMTLFFERLSGEMAHIVQRLYFTPPPPSSVVSSPTMPLSPAISVQSTVSTNSANSWTTQSPDLFRHFNMAVLQPPMTPALSPINEPIKTVEPTMFDPAIGSQRRKHCPWNMGFPKLSLMTVDSLWKDGMDDLSNLVC